ncbi:MAG: filamentous hemagglutinin N-terminal domain-containing protein, partial [Verrucomicrobia bacterium]|nr:filamentous hemagglutinin N-terminal domain-containing protein [Verrucomicrobiota bacterium]
MNNQRFISFILIIAHFNQIIVFGAVGIIPDGSTRTFVTQTEQGVDLVNIARANASGLSRNNYDDFNVSERGVIFNNNAGHDPVSSSRGEAIRENIMLQGEAAQVILNQVTSVRKSELLGDMEVVGARADVIIANPNGIRVQGSRFINVDPGILTTGRPMFSDDGAIQGFDINGGTIEFGDQGLNASETDELLLITNQLQIKGAIHAKKIKAFTGNNTVQRNAVGEMEATNETNPNPHDGIGI